MDKWLIKAKPSYEELEAKLAKAESELASLKEVNALNEAKEPSSVNKALNDLNELKEKSSWAAEIATACGKPPGLCPQSVIEFGAALDGSTGDTVLPSVTQLLPGFACTLAQYEATFVSHHAFRTAAPTKRMSREASAGAKPSNWEDEITWCSHNSVSDCAVSFALCPGILPDGMICGAITTAATPIEAYSGWRGNELEKVRIKARYSGSRSASPARPSTPVVDAAAPEEQPALIRGDPNKDAFRCEICNFVMPIGYARADEMYRNYDPVSHNEALSNIILNEKKRKKMG